MKMFLRLLPFFLLSACATQKVKYANESLSGRQTINPQSQLPYDKSPLVQRLYLVGDAGLTEEGQKMNPVLRHVRESLSKEAGASSVFFLGDNIYPAGLPDKKKKPEEYKKAKHQLDAQLESVKNFKGQVVFIPGNHDWYSNGLEGLKRQENYIEKNRDQRDVFCPSEGMPDREDKPEPGKWWSWPLIRSGTLPIGTGIRASMTIAILRAEKLFRKKLKVRSKRIGIKTVISCHAPIH